MTYRPPAVSFPIVGIGASAGGLSAFEAFFSGMPTDFDPGMAFVLVQHLAPDHKSILSQLIRRFTRMQVFEVEDGMVVQPNCAYIIPPNHGMEFFKGTLHLKDSVVPHGKRLTIDHFFQSLADELGPRSIGIVLSGTGTDGTLGMRAIKEAGGMAIAQSMESSEFDGMPSSALATGLVDYELAPADMAAQLIAYVAHGFDKGVAHRRLTGQPREETLKAIFVMLRAQTGHDFSQYKPSTILRRIERRMSINQVAAIGDYVRFIQQTPSETLALFNDLLIGVTQFFRDPDAFAVLETQVVPQLFAGKPAGAPIRIWSTGCSTGEEAYSLAILLVERMEQLNQNYAVQVFATDLDPRAIAAARAGLYPSSIAADISPARLARFFTPEPGGQTYRIHKRIRDLLIFSEQDLIKDPPFSRLDLISCRNLLIYLDADLQKRLIPLFHYALKPAGVLFLGSSEGIGEFDNLFSVQDRKAKIYQRKGTYSAAPRSAASRYEIPSLSMNDPQPAPQKAKTSVTGKLSLRQLMEQALIKQLAPASALVNAEGDILYLHGRTGMYLEPSPGEVAVQNILKMARDGLRPGLSQALHVAKTTEQAGRAMNLKVKTNGHYTQVNVGVYPVNMRDTLAVGTSVDEGATMPLYLVVLEDIPDVPGDLAIASSSGDVGLPADAQVRIDALMQDLRTKDEYLQSALEELESSNEELKSSNEEMQSVNEELQSTNEELETSKEELQSVNEELATVNAELQTKVTDLSHANNDMNNLLAGTGIGTVFVDFELRILRFTPAISSIINLIGSDIGRPVTHIASNLAGYNGLVSDIKAVLDSLAAIEREVQTIDGHWYTLRIQPYRTLNNVIEGAVISFVNVSALVETREALQRANEQLRLAVVVRDASDAITVQDLQGRTLAWNPSAVRLYGWTEAQALEMNVRDRIPEAQREGEMEKLNRLCRAEVLEPYLTQRLAETGDSINVSIISSALVDKSGKMYAIATTERASSIHAKRESS